MDNPFNATFGELPQSFVSREKDIATIRTAFGGDNPESKVYVISGARGSGKTVLLTALTNLFKDDGYICVDLNPYEDLNEQFASKLYEGGRLRKLFLHPEFSFSFKGVSLTVSGDTEISNVYTFIEKMLSYLKKKKKRVLITIDDVSNNDCVKSFIFSFQQMIRSGYDVFLLVTGLYENVSELERNKSLTFFLRAPKLNLEPLNLFEIVSLYKSLLSLGESDAIKAAKLTKGYAYAYQLMGSLIYTNGIKPDILDEYDKRLIQNSYSLTWEKLTRKEKEFLYALADSTSQKDITKALNMSNGNYQTYKKRLADRGLILAKERGKVDFALPRFKEFVRLEKALSDDEE